MIRPQTCPICKTELPPEAATRSKWFPFCGERCRNVDLARWSDGRYAIVDDLSPDQIVDELEKQGIDVEDLLDDENLTDF
ncbi:DNA gyrase inhibitor YacG [Stratiformator vulcanicus]|nr:DNA gyrase inhibitor YacG [Stratiformator vulcanicus]